jgi:hypothetical protein
MYILPAILLTESKFCNGMRLRDFILLLLLLTPIEFSFGGSSPYNSTNKINKNKYT